LEDAAFAELETDGELPPERIETLLSAIFFVLSLIANKQGISPDIIERYAGNVHATRPQKYVPLTQEEIEKREDDETRRMFAPALFKIKTAITSGGNNLFKN